MSDYPKGICRLGIVGCGAITERGYLPAASLIEGVAVTHVVDLDRERGGDVAARFHIPGVFCDYRDLFGKVDAVVVATPPSSHARISIDCLDHGLHVLCEKPLAVSVQEAREMIAVSERACRHLAVGMVRRLGWSSKLLKRLIEINMLGDIDRFDVEEGSQFNWPLRTAHIFQDRDSGGVIADTGPHLFDLLFWILGSQNVKLVRCRDDGWEGVEANAVVELKIERNSRCVPGKIEFSFTRGLRNTLRVYGQKGCLEAPTLGGYEVTFYPDSQHSDPIILKAQGAVPREWFEEFAIQLSNFAYSIRNNTKRYVAAGEAIATMSIVEECHRSRELISQPWETKHLESFFGGEQSVS
jgi:predicted dehydrogenase